MRLDARTKLLNPKWYEGMLSSGYEGVREIQKRLTNTVGWSATSGQVDNWVYDEVSTPTHLASYHLSLMCLKGLLLDLPARLIPWHRAICALCISMSH